MKLHLIIALSFLISCLYNNVCPMDFEEPLSSCASRIMNAPLEHDWQDELHKLEQKDSTYKELLKRELYKESPMLCVNTEDDFKVYYTINKDVSDLVQANAVNESGNQIAFATHDSLELYEYDFNKENVKSLFYGRFANVKKIGFDGNKIRIATDTEVFEKNSDKFESLCSFKYPIITDKDCRYALLLDNIGGTKIFDLKTKIIKKISQQICGEVSTFASSESGKHMVVGTKTGWLIKLIKDVNGYCYNDCYQLDRDNDSITVLDMSQDGDHILASNGKSFYHIPFLYSVSREIKETSLGKVTCGRLLPTYNNNNQAVLGFESGYVAIWDFNTMLKKFQNLQAPIKSVIPMNGALFIMAMNNQCTILSLISNMAKQLSLPQLIMLIKYREYGVKALTLDSFKTVCQDLLKQAESGGIEDKEKLLENEFLCSICSEQLIDTQLSCNHSFCTSCITGWLKRENSCPACRAPDTSAAAAAASV